LTTTSANSATKRHTSLKQKTAKAARWLHIYLSMVSFAIILFFAVSGLTVNHPDWFADSVKTRQAEGPVDIALLHPGAEPDKAALIQTMRTREHLHGAVDEVRIDEYQINFSYRAPGYSADIAIDRQKGTYTLTETRNGFVAVINDLHKGRDAGKGWKLLIDISAILLTLVSLTGLIILFFIYKRRASGLIIAAVGAALCIFIYKIFVP
jgi:uncharacterized protein